MNGNLTKAEARQRVSDLVSRFRRNEHEFRSPNYNETQARTEFITPLLEALGWDVHNLLGQPLGLREVIEEATVEVGEERLSKKPDYELRLARQRKLFVEAKKPNVSIDRDRAAAFQTRRYGYSASLPISVLTNFHQLVVYDCRPTPSNTDDARVARLKIIPYEEFEDRFDELWSTLSREVVYSGEFDRQFQVEATRQGADQFDDYFLRQVRGWRERLARDLYTNTPELSEVELTYSVHLFLLRIVFLRICEDRDLEQYETLKNIDSDHPFDAFMRILRSADEFYNSGLFRMIDDERLRLRVSDDTLRSIVDELYYPQSPYTFAVVETEVLGEIYEQFLGEVISVRHGHVEVVRKEEVRESGGVVPTPRYIVNAIVDRVLDPAIAGRTPTELSAFTVADICCGSGIFLLGAYEHLLDSHLAWYLTNNRQEHIGNTIFEIASGHWRLVYAERRRILLNCIRGVDIDSSAVEVARFSLLLKLIEGEDRASLEEYVRSARQPALPPLGSIVKCGNSLVSDEEWREALGPMPATIVSKVNPFTWANEFHTEIVAGGFDVIVGNPPYIRIQAMQSYSPEEAAYYKHPSSPYSTAHQDNFDKYALFIERSLTLLNPTGTLGVIVPHKFMTILAGHSLRRLLTSGKRLSSVVHFGVKQVFGTGTTNYTCILVAGRSETERVTIERVNSLATWRYGTAGTVEQVASGTFSDANWQFLDVATSQLFQRIRRSHSQVLNDVAEIFVGVQTSADDVYIIHPTRTNQREVICEWDGRSWPIERGILRPCLHDVTISAYERPQANAWIIFPYTIETTRSGRQSAVLVPPDVLRRDYPHCWAYLQARRAELRDRNITGGRTADRQWYQYGRSQSLTKFSTPKIILPILSTEARYAPDDANTVVTGGGNGPYYLVRSLNEVAVPTHFLLAVLNHPVCEALVRTNTSPFRGGYYSHGKQFIEDLPIPNVSRAAMQDVVSLVQDLIQTLDDARNARTPHTATVKQRRATQLRAQIQEAVGVIFGLSADDALVLAAVPIPS